MTTTIIIISTLAGLCLATKVKKLLRKKAAPRVRYTNGRYAHKVRVSYAGEVVGGFYL